MKFAMNALFCMLMFLIQGCVYQFSNLEQRIQHHPPTRIFVENVRNNSKVNLPYEILWEEIQRHFISSNQLSPSSIEHADFFLRTTAVMVTKKQFNSNNASNEPYSVTLINPSTNEPNKLSKYSTFKKASVYSTKKKIRLQVTIELWSLLTRKKILTKSYSQEIQWDLINADTKPSTIFIRSSENQDFFFKMLSSRLSQSITHDCLNVAY